MKAISELDESVYSADGTELLTVNKLENGQYKSYKVRLSVIKAYLSEE